MLATAGCGDGGPQTAAQALAPAETTTAASDNGAPGGAGPRTGEPGEAEHEGRKGRGPEEQPPEPARSDDGGPCHNSAGDDVASTKVWKLIRATDGSCHACLLVVIIKLTLGDLRSDVTRPPSEALHLRGADFERWSRSLLQGLGEDMADLQRRDPAAWDEYQAEVEMLTTFNGID